MNVTFEQFLWLCHYVLCGFYVLTIAYGLFERFQFAEAYKRTKQFYEETIYTPPDHGIDKMVGALLGGHAFCYGLAIKAVPVWLILLILVAAYFAKTTADAEPAVRVAKKEMKAQGNTNNAHGFTSAPDDETNDFDYEESAFSGKGSASRSSTEDLPRGVADRHTDDAKLWAVVDDPSATPSERKSALDKVLRKEAKRNGQTGQELVFKV